MKKRRVCVTQAQYTTSCTTMESRTNKRKRVPDPADQEWVKPANVPKELRDCVASLASTVNTVSCCFFSMLFLCKVELNEGRTHPPFT